uniref:NADH-ubiquinone oxidoreductase chain 1 n=1 Tax=Diaphorina lycii TaxID=2047824 RepID=A0A343M3B6_9HEMI|nr:NADH dehydrogenase subunit 1 [Diaphorina lycii]ATR80195.1 NADH dehydrogenase subunit 1 [Diaphorina lycii]
MSLFSLISVAFLTLLERKVLGFVQLRKGPNKSGMVGIFQPFSDAIKLYTKEFFIPLKSNDYPYWVTPLIALGISLSAWVVYPYFYLLSSWKLSVMYMFCVLSVGVYSIMVSGWFSNSSYSILGCMRVLAQSISYEVSFFFLVLCLLYFSESASMLEFLVFQQFTWFLTFLFPIFLMLLVSFLAELNRTPFDFSEGESELVSGFNVEYGGSGFAFIFLSEYLSILFSSVVLALFFLGSLTEYLFYFKMGVVSVFIIIIRGTLPRYRYDKLMSMCWKTYLTVVLFLMLFYSIISL